MSQGELRRPEATSLTGDRITTIQLPESLRFQLLGFRSRVWSSKLIESLLIALVVVGLSLLTVYCVDRWIDTPVLVRVSFFLAAALVWLVLPTAIYRWVWRQRKLEQLARLLRVREPAVGDQLLSAIELVANDSEQARSRTLCAAAIRQVADAAQTRDLTAAAPLTQLRPLTIALLLLGLVLGGLSIAFPTAFQNAVARLAMPWRNTPRFTFAIIQPLDAERVVPHGEPTTLPVALDAATHRRPQLAHLKIGDQPVLSSSLAKNSAYDFQVPPLVDTAAATIQIGDFTQSLTFRPMMRPQLTDISAQVTYPSYLQRPAGETVDVRSGKLIAVEGSTAQFNAVISRQLSTASLDSQTLQPADDRFSTDAIPVALEERNVELNWQDEFGLSSQEPFRLSIVAVPDAAPSVAARQLPRQSVVMDSEQLNFEALAGDDFGVRRIGYSWIGLDQSLQVQPAEGEKVLIAGGPDQSSIQAPATFCATDLGIEAQPIEMRLWVEDYLPDRPRVYSPPHVLFVLTPDQHAIWIMDQLSKWHKAAVDVRDKEMQLYEENKRLREMSEDELADAKMRDALRRQAALENANARRLALLTQNGEQLVKTASRNPEIGVGHLERWAEMLQILNDIGNNRMPTVADLLDDASSQKQLARSTGSKRSAPKAGQNRSSGGPSEPTQTDGEQRKPSMPKVSDGESSLAGPGDESGDQTPQKKKSSPGRLTLPTTTVADNSPAKKSDPPPEENQDEEPIDEAISEQTDLLAEFQKVADELNDVLANLEGSTLVKRLKAASREQVQVAEKITSRLDSVFGKASKATREDRNLFKGLTAAEETSRQAISYIMDDMQAYFERRKMNQFKLVLDEMRETEILDALTDLGVAIPKRQGVSIAQAEYWADTLDRWADDLVDPACSGKCPGCKSSDALPPSLILEAMRILEAEVNLRESTRVAEQAKAAVDADVHQSDAEQLAETQAGIYERIESLIQAIRDLPEGDARFGKELTLLSNSAAAMDDAQGILAGHETGSRAIAAETEAIEWLLRSKKINPRGGGGGGTDPGGGGTGTTQDSALALMGTGLNAKERREAREIAQTTGDKARIVPEEFRHGLDQYFNQLETAE